VLFATREFGFVRLPDSMTTGSSIMPQKKNPDVFELVRGHAATAQAALYEALAITAKLPSGYHRDLQLLKAPLFRSFDRALASAEILAATLPEIEFVAERVVLDADLFAAERAYRLVLDEGIPFREAYRRVAAELADGPTNSARPAQARPEQAD
jgi:argininosuccinate lyase